MAFQLGILKDGADVLKLPITWIINSLICENTVPSEMKLARFKPLYKTNSNLEVGNYRLVSILSIVSKILERAVYVQLEKCLVDNNILYGYQSGFRRTYSMNTCLIHLLDHIKVNNSSGLYTGMILLDLQKAFDTVDHVILCNKLKTMGVGCTDWFLSYLQNMHQIVTVCKV